MEWNRTEHNRKERRKGPSQITCHSMAKAWPKHGAVNICNECSAVHIYICNEQINNNDSDSDSNNNDNNNSSNDIKV